MKHFLYKKSLEIFGAGAGKPSLTPPVPPIVSQYPNALVPPNNGDISSINSFSYAEMIDLISDGPIEGLVNRKGIKVSEDNVFEGIYLNNTPIKETSDISKQRFEISFLANEVKAAWALSQTEFSKGTSYKYTIPAASIPANNGDIDFPQKSNSTITVYSPETSISQFLLNTNSNLSNLSKLKRYFDNTPTEGEKPFLTIVNLSEIIFYLDKVFFDPTEGGQNQNYPLKISIPNFSDYVYFTIGPTNLNSFNYFEMPKTFALNPILTPNGERTFFKSFLTGISESKIKLQTFNIKLFIWSIYSKEVGIKKISDDVFNKYLTSIFVYQNNPSLFNYNLVNSKFKNGNPIQSPLDGFNEVNIDTEYGKELVGPFRLAENNWFAGALIDGGIARVKDLRLGTNYDSIATINLDQETSDDVRKISDWPIEMSCRGQPYIIRNIQVNYASFDKATSQRSCQEAIPVTHYIANDNVEKVYVSIAVNSLSDTNHIDLASKFESEPGTSIVTDSKYKIVKYARTPSVPLGGKTYSQLAGTLSKIDNATSNTTLTKYLLIYGQNKENAYILDGADTKESAVINYKCITKADQNNVPYRNAIRLFSTIFTDPSTYIGVNKYDLTSNSNLMYYSIPNSDSSALLYSFNTSAYSNSPASLEQKLKTLDENGFLYYCYGLPANAKILSTSYFSIEAAGITPSPSIPGYSFSLLTFQYSIFQPQSNELRHRAIVGINIIPYLNLKVIFLNADTVVNSYHQYVPENKKNQYAPNYSAEKYPNVHKYITIPIATNQTFTSGTLIYLTTESLEPIFLLSINYSYLSSFTQYFVNGKLTLDGLEFFLQNYAFKNNNDAYFPAFKTVLTNTTNGLVYGTKDSLILESFLNSTQQINSNLLNGVYLYEVNAIKSNLMPYYSQDEINLNPTYFNVFGDASKNYYNVNSIYLANTNSDYILRNDVDIIFLYSFYENITIDSATNVGNTLDMQFIDKDLTSGNETAKSLSEADKKAILKSQMQIGAGAKLPAVVSLEVETGYEKYGETESDTVFKSYQFDIYGTVNQKALLDLGRNAYSNVVSSSKNVNSRNFLSSYFKRMNYNSQKIYLIRRSSYKPNTTTLETNYLTQDINQIFAGSFTRVSNPTCVFQTSFFNSYLPYETKNPISSTAWTNPYGGGAKVKKIYDASNSLIGLRSCYLTTEDINYFRDRIDNYASTKKSTFILTNDIFQKYFDGSYNFSLSKLTECAESVPTSTEATYKILPNKAYSYTDNLKPHSTLVTNTGTCDVYKFIQADNNYEELKIYTYDYEVYEFYDLLENNAKFTTKDLYTTVFVEQGPPIIKDLLKNLNPSTSIVYSFSKQISFDSNNFDNYASITNAIDENLKTFPETYTIYISSTAYTETNLNDIFNKICSSAANLGKLI
jgi:hypothetical protein